jgi:chromosome segregation ATPase
VTLTKGHRIQFFESFRISYNTYLWVVWDLRNPWHKFRQLKKNTPQIYLLLLESIIDQLQRDNRDFKMTEVKNSEEIDQLLKTIQNLKEQSDHSTENSNLREKTQELQLQLTTLKVDNKKLQDDLAKLEQEKLQIQLNIADDQRGPSDSIIELTEQLKSLQNNLTESQTKADILKSQLADSERCYSDQIEDLTDKLRVASEKENEMENYKFKLEEEVKHFGETAASAETEIVRLQSQLADLDSVNDELRNKIGEIEKLKNDLNETKQKLDSNSDEIEELRSQSSQLGQQNQELREIAKNNQGFATTVVELESQLAENTDKYNKAKAEIDETVAKNVFMRAENNRLQEELDKSVEKIKTLKNIERSAANLHSTEDEVNNAKIRDLEKVLANNEID